MSQSLPYDEKKFDIIIETEVLLNTIQKIPRKQKTICDCSDEKII